MAMDSRFQLTDGLDLPVVKQAPQPVVDPNDKKTSVSGIKVLGSGFSTGSKYLTNEDLADLGYD